MVAKDEDTCFQKRIRERRGGASWIKCVDVEIVLSGLGIVGPGITSTEVYTMSFIPFGDENMGK